MNTITSIPEEMSLEDNMAPSPIQKRDNVLITMAKESTLSNPIGITTGKDNVSM